MKSNPKENIPQLIDYLFKAYGQKVAEKVLWEYVDDTKGRRCKDESNT